MTEPTNRERGPVGLPSLSNASGEPEVREGEQFDTNIMRMVIPRQWKTAPFADPVLGLEIREGPYKDVIFGFSGFTILPTQLEDGMVPARFDTVVFKSPTGFQKDEAFDHFCRELLLAWLHFIAVNDLGGLIKAEGVKGIQ